MPRSRALVYLTGVVAANPLLQLVVREPLAKHVRLEGLLATAGVALLPGSDGGFCLLPALVGIFLGSESASRSLSTPDVEIVSRVARLAISADSLARETHDHRP